MNSQKSDNIANDLVEVANAEFEKFQTPEGNLGSPRLCFIHGFLCGYRKALENFYHSSSDETFGI